jgi:hypothetical protein
VFLGTDLLKMAELKLKERFALDAPAETSNLGIQWTLV